MWNSWVARAADALAEVVDAAVPSRDLPAMIVVDNGVTQAMADSGVVLPGQSCFEASGYDSSGLVDSARAYFTIDGVLWPVSVNLASVLLYYNRDHFLRAGLDPDDPPGSLPEVRRYAETIRAAGVAPAPLVLEFSAWLTEHWLTGAGSPVVDNGNGRGGGETRRANLAGNPDALALFDWYASMVDDGLLAPARTVTDEFAALLNGNASMAIWGSGAASTVEAMLGGEGGDAAAGALEIDAGPFPGLGGGHGAAIDAVAWYLISTSPPEVQAAAWDFAMYLNGAEAQTRLLIDGSLLPSVASVRQAPEAAAFLAGERGIAGAWQAIANEQLLAIDPAFPGPLMGPYDEFHDAVQTAEEQVVLEGRRPADALIDAQAAIDAALDRYADGNF